MSVAPCYFYQKQNIMNQRKTGDKCSKNMVFVKRIETMSELMDVFHKDPSVFWIHRPFPCAFVMHQPFIVLVNAINNGRLWKIAKNQPIG